MRDLHFDFRYKTLEKVLETGSYTSAGKTLSLTASAVSQQIHSLENELQTVLFTKTGGKLLPTEDCRAIARYLGRINALCEQMCEELETSQSNFKHVTLGLTQSIESGALAAVLSENQDRIDGIQITVKTDTAQNLGEMLRDGRIDFAIIDGSFEDRGLNSVILDTDTLGAVVLPESSYAKKRSISLQELKKERIILRPSGTGTRNLLNAALQKAGLSSEMLHIMLEVNSPETILKLVKEGFGISILSEKVCLKELGKQKLSFVPVADLNMVRNIRLFYRDESEKPDLLQTIQSLYFKSTTDPV